jgi:hypothetical protein
MLQSPNRSIGQIHSTLSALQNNEGNTSAVNEAYRALTDLCLHVAKLEEEVQILRQKK